MPYKFVNIAKLFLVPMLAALIINYSLQDLWIFISFKFNQSYISENLCENKDKPKSCCEGKCQLKKSFENSDQTTKAIPQFNESKEISPLINNGKLLTIDSQMNKTFYNSYCESLVVTKIISKIFHPPPSEIIV